MIYSVFILLLTIIALMCYYLFKHITKREVCISFKESLDLTDLPIITMENDGNKFHFLLDTGSNLNHISTHCAELFDGEVLNTGSSIMGIDGNSTVYRNAKVTLSYNNYKFEDEFTLTDLEQAFKSVKESCGIEIHGILGSNFFKKYGYILDFNELKFYGNIK